MDRVRTAVESTDTRGWGRRAVVLALAGGLAGCFGVSESSDEDGGGSSATPTDTPTDSPSPTETDSPTETATPEPAEGYVDLKPADADASYADRSVFDEFDGDVAIELDLHEATLDRHFAKIERVRQPEPIKEFALNYDDPEWRQQIVEEAENKNYYSNLEDPVDQEHLKTTDDIQERLLNGVIDVPNTDSIEQPSLWSMFAVTNLGGYSSTNNEMKAAALQAAEVRRINDKHDADPETENEEFGDTYQSPLYPTRETVDDIDNIIYALAVDQDDGGGHGVYQVFNRVTDESDETAQQRVLLGETDPYWDQQLTEWENSDYPDDNTELGSAFDHPAEYDHKDKNWKAANGLLGSIASNRSEILENIEFSELVLEETRDFYENPESARGQHIVDTMITAGRLAEEGYSVEVRSDGLYVEEQAAE
ncbi:hypothetical protein RYH80_05250 [Halobaculum sp. MBLA0147]|uniref:hypothetical protein n=1 Tax=Halobaculum sp. MBLA0147 TaxID=3079934 RepID=UPI003526926F